MIEKLKAYLKINGVNSKLIEGSTDMLSFSLDNLNYLFVYDKEADPTYVQMMLPKVGKYTTWDDNLENLNQLYKGGKVVVVRNEIILVVDSFIYGNTDAPALFSRMISILGEMIKEYRRKCNG